MSDGRLAPAGVGWHRLGVKMRLVGLNEEGRQIGGFVGPLLSFPRPTALPCG